jgi:molybdate transport system substrate-binding protein
VRTQGRWKGRAAGLLALVAGALVLAASAAAVPDRAAAQVRVLAAASLTDVFPKIDPTAQYSFAGSDTLAGQIRLGAPADVFAAANTSLPNQLYARGLVEKPVVFTTNKLVLVVPTANPAGIKSVFDLRRPGIKLVVGTAAVPIGSYTRTILRNLALSGVLSNVVSEETDVRSILGKVALGEADAGFVYVTDARTAGDRLNVISLPAWAQPPVRYGIAVLRSTQDRAAAVAFIDKVLARSGQARLRAAGFGAVKNAVTSY